MCSTVCETIICSSQPAVPRSWESIAALWNIETRRQFVRHGQGPDSEDAKVIDGSCWKSTLAITQVSDDRNRSATFVLGFSRGLCADYTDAKMEKPQVRCGFGDELVCKPGIKELPTNWRHHDDSARVPGHRRCCDLPPVPPGLADLKPPDLMGTRSAVSMADRLHPGRFCWWLLQYLPWRWRGYRAWWGENPGENAVRLLVLG